MQNNLLTAILCILAFTSTFYAQNRTVTEDRKPIIIEATVLKIGSKPKRRNGTLLLAIQLVKYQVERVNDGYYKEEEIVVDHILKKGDELDGIKVGDKVCLKLDSYEKFLQKTYAEGIRNRGDNVETFFVGEEKITKITDDPSKCQRQ